VNIFSYINYCLVFEAVDSDGQWTYWEYYSQLNCWVYISIWDYKDSVVKIDNALFVADIKEIVF
jgi:hypothetical protein